MSFAVQVVADSVNTASPNRERITTLLCTFPRFILAEVNTHRMFSRNSASSRAIPFKKMQHAVMENPFIPIAWQKFHSGMQGTEYLDEAVADVAKMEWLHARDMAVKQATILNGEFEVTKQLCNRLLEPFMWHTALITATEFENFFALRCPQYTLINHSPKKEIKVYRSWKDAEIAFGSELGQCAREAGFKDESDPMFQLFVNKGQGEIHIMKLAEMMWDALNESTPRELRAGEWHIPFGDQIDSRELIKAWVQEKNIPVDEAGNFLHGKKEMLYDAYKLKIATARTAQTSYTLVGEEGKPMDYAKLIALHDRLAASGHMSPFEHCAQAMTKQEYKEYVSGRCTVATVGEDYVIAEASAEGWCGNFRGWIQYRKQFPNENHTK
jgi:hypothetical protein